MKLEDIVTMLSIIMTVLAIGLTLVTGYLAYLTHTLEKRVRDSLLHLVEEKRRELGNLVEARLSIVDVVVEAICSRLNTNEGSDLPEEIYFLRHLSRLTSGDPNEINKALGALEAGGSSVQHLLPYVERVRSVSSWPNESQMKFESILRKTRDAARTNRVES